MTDAADPREELKAALATRDAARKNRDDAAASLSRADAVAKSATDDLGVAKAALASAEGDRAAEFAAVIKKGRAPELTVDAATKAARALFGEAESKHAVARTVRDQLTTEHLNALAIAKAAEQAAEAAAIRVVVGEVEERAAVARIEALLRDLAALDDLTFAAARLWHAGKPLELTPELRRIVSRLQPLRRVIAESGARPPRAILTGTAEDEAAARLREYVAALQQNADTKLDDIATPKIERPRLPPADEIEASRLRGELEITAAA